jgi:hypothetical protein
VIRNKASPSMIAKHDVASYLVKYHVFLLWLELANLIDDNGLRRETRSHSPPLGVAKFATFVIVLHGSGPGCGRTVGDTHRGAAGNGGARAVAELETLQMGLIKNRGAD